MTAKSNNNVVNSTSRETIVNQDIEKALKLLASRERYQQSEKGKAARKRAQQKQYAKNLERRKEERVVIAELKRRFGSLESALKNI